MIYRSPFALPLGLALASLACTSRAPGGATPESPAETPAQFVAFAANFDQYRSWRHFTVLDDAGMGGAVHLDTTLVEYCNSPAIGDREAFPQGTIIVKEGITGDPDTRQAFAMVKRGGGYNASGTTGWEWFELANADDANDIEILWRGVAPPSGEVYSGNVRGDCNTCHESAPHDGVFAQ